MTGNSATVTVSSATIATQNDGTFNVANAHITDIAGNVGATSGNTSVTVDTVAPLAPDQPDLVPLSDTGSLTETT